MKTFIYMIIVTPHLTSSSNGGGSCTSGEYAPDFVKEWVQDAMMECERSSDCEEENFYEIKLTVMERDPSWYVTSGWNGSLETPRVRAYQGAFYHGNRDSQGRLGLFTSRSCA